MRKILVVLIAAWFWVFGIWPLGLDTHEPIGNPWVLLDLAVHLAGGFALGWCVGAYLGRKLSERLFANP